MNPNQEEEVITFQENSIPGSSNPPEMKISNENIEDLTRKGKMKITECGFETINVSGQGNESLYKAVSYGLEGDEADYLNIYKIGITKMSQKGREGYEMDEALYKKYVDEMDVSGVEVVNPHYVLSAVAEALSVEIIVFNASGKNIQFSPPVGTLIECTAYVLCVPSISSLSQAYALEAIVPVTTLHQTEEIHKRIWRQNSIPDSFTSTFEHADSH